MSRPPLPRSPEGAVASDMREGAELVLSGVGGRLRAVLESIQPGEVAPRDLERELKLHKTLCWRVLQVAYAREPLAAAPYMPGDEGMEKFLRAAGVWGVEKPVLEAVREATARYRAVVKHHAGDRASFEVMAMSLASPKEDAVELRVARRAAYRSAGYTWGVQTAVRVLAGIITPVGDDLVDFATLRAHIRARRVRKEGVIRLSRTVEHDTDNPGPRRVMALPIEPESVVGGVPLLPEFSTRPLPKLAAFELPNKNIEYRFTEQALGEQSGVTVFTGEVRRNLEGARWRTETNASNAIMMTIRDPVGLGVIDLWAPSSFANKHRALVVSAIAIDPLVQKPEEWHVLPTSISVERMGRGLLAARLGEAPAYEHALAHCFRRLRWAANEYELFRVRQDYPVLGSCLVLQTELPGRQ